MISYWVMTGTLISIINKDSDLLGGMWAGVNTGSVFRMTHEDSWQAGMAQLIATNVSFALCLLCLSFFPFTGVGMAALIGIGTLVMILLDRRDDIVTTGTTTAAAMWCSHQSAGCLASTAAAPWLTPWSELGLASHAKGRLRFSISGSSGNPCDDYPRRPACVDSGSGGNGARRIFSEDRI